MTGLKGNLFQNHSLNGLGQEREKGNRAIASQLTEGGHLDQRSHLNQCECGWKGEEGRVEFVSVCRGDGSSQCLREGGWYWFPWACIRTATCQEFRYFTPCEWYKCGEEGRERLSACRRMAELWTQGLLRDEMRCDAFS